MIYMQLFTWVGYGLIGYVPNTLYALGSINKLYIPLIPSLYVDVVKSDSSQLSNFLKTLASRSNI
jgi:hypothetical protein